MKPVGFIDIPELIIFADASTLAFGAVAYLRWRISETEFECRLVMAKCKLAPMRQLPIPKVELCSAVLAVRMKNYRYKTII